MVLALQRSLSVKAVQVLVSTEVLEVSVSVRPNAETEEAEAEAELEAEAEPEAEPAPVPILRPQRCFLCYCHCWRCCSICCRTSL
jgi:hypothetical protein